MMGLAIWHFTIFLPDRFWGGIVGAFLGARHRRDPVRPDRQRPHGPRARRHAHPAGPRGDSGRAHRRSRSATGRACARATSPFTCRPGRRPAAGVESLHVRRHRHRSPLRGGRDSDAAGPGRPRRAARRSRHGRQRDPARALHPSPRPAAARRLGPARVPAGHELPTVEDHRDGPRGRLAHELGAGGRRRPDRHRAAPLTTGRHARRRRRSGRGGGPRALRGRRPDRARRAGRGCAGAPAGPRPPRAASTPGSSSAPMAGARASRVVSGRA